MLVRFTKTILAAALVCTLCLPAAAAQNTAPGSEFTGTAWMGSTQNERLAFLYGVSNVVAIEQLLAEKEGVKPSLFVRDWMKAFGNANWAQIEKKLNDWYAAHPDQMSRGVFDVLWYEFMVPASK